MNYIILDAREKKEFNVSHLKGALNIGYDNIDKNVITQLDKNKTIVVYCSIGYRSEKVGELLRAKGYKVTKLIWQYL